MISNAIKLNTNTGWRHKVHVILTQITLNAEYGMYLTPPLRFVLPCDSVVLG